ncbi:MAG: SDR family oxidoreductase [Actinomycetota bacterium]|nr:SDR family oxidoreductase [Actinomycetota bacterium]
MAARFPLHGKVALVTGGARGIGLETARLLHERGATVAILDLERSEAETAAESVGERTHALEADVTDAGGMDLAVDEVVRQFGGLDVVVANAGIAPKPRPMSVMGSEEFERVIDVDLLGVWHTVRPALPQIIERQGHIVVVASVYAFMNGMMAAPYAMAKAGVEALGRSLRVELAPHGASAGVAYFGFIDTNMVREALADPIGRRVQDVAPGFMIRRLTPPVAGAAIVNGIERRAPRMIAPRWWAALSVMRGAVNPMIDRWAARDRDVAAAIRDGEEATPEASASNRA